MSYKAGDFVWVRKCSLQGAYSDELAIFLYEKFNGIATVLTCGFSNDVGEIDVSFDRLESATTMNLKKKQLREAIALQHEFFRREIDKLRSSS